MTTLKTFTLDEGVIAAKVSIIKIWNDRMRLERQQLEAAGKTAEEIEDHMRLCREIFDEWLPAELAALRRSLINGFTN